MSEVLDRTERLLAASKLLEEDSTTLEKFDSITTLLKGINPKIDKSLEKCQEVLAKYDLLKEGEVIELSLEQLPEEEEKEKKRKKAILLFIRYFRDLKGEVERVRDEMEKENTSQSEQVSSFSKVVAGAKGPLGIITILAVIVVGSLIYLNSRTQINPEVSSKEKIKVIEFNGKKIPLSEVAERAGSDCDSLHYHANNHMSVRALDGSIVADPGGCGFGRVKEVAVIEVE